MFLVIVNYMLYYQEVFPKLLQKFLLKKDTMKEKMEILPNMLFIKIFCYLKTQVLFILFMFINISICEYTYTICYYILKVT